MKDRGNHNIRGQEGLTLVELLVVIAIISVIATLAIMQRGRASENFRRQNVALDLKSAFERARFDSVKRRADGAVPFAYVEIFPTSFTLRTYSDGVAEDQPYPFPANIIASGYNFSITGSVRVEFNRRGEATVVGGGNPQFMVCNGASCPAAPGDDTTNTVLVTPTGTVNLLSGGIAIPTFADPAVSNPASSIRQEVVLP